MFRSIKPTCWGRKNLFYSHQRTRNKQDLGVAECGGRVMMAPGMAENDSFRPCFGAHPKCQQNAHPTEPFHAGVFWASPLIDEKIPVRAGLCDRVSTHGQQTLLLHRRAMRDYATRLDG